MAKTNKKTESVMCETGTGWPSTETYLIFK